MSGPFGPWEDAVDKATEGLFAAGLLVVAAGMAWIGRRQGLAGQAGWRPMMWGLGLLAAWATLDLLDEFVEGLWIVAGVDSEPFVEDLILPLCGVGLLAFGILRWAPMHARVAALEKERQEEQVTRLREADAFKTMFLSTAAHELATPLTPIRVQLSILKGRGDTAGIELLDRNVGRLERLVQDLSDASRLQSGTLRFDMGETDVGDLVDELEASFSHPCAEVGITLRVAAASDLRIGSGDETRISQVLHNLVSNAVKFTPAGGDVSVGARREGKEVVVDVVDTGAGLEAHELEGLFAPFRQFHRDVVGSHVGTGLGLYIAQGIARRHGGSIEAHSEGRGTGSRFRLRLPAGRVAQAGSAGPLMARAA